jgi:hypothetical protein
VGEFAQLAQEELYGLDGYLITVRQMYAFECRVAITQSINSLVCQVCHSYKAYTSQLRQCCELKNGHVSEVRTV